MTGTRAVAVMACLAVALAGCGGTPASNPHDADRAAAALHPDLGPFAGYVWTGDVGSAHADWTVPRLLPGSAPGEAATWIGAEAPGPTRAAPFVQVGINEGNTEGASAPFYYAFYSTTKLRFHPVHLFVVSPGDHVSATLRRRGARWEIAFADRTAGRERQLSVAEGAGRHFNEVQYIQEDVTDARTSRPLPYPSLSPVRFTAVAADGAAPAPDRLSSDWLTEADGYLAPARLRGSAFTLMHVRPTAAGLRSLRSITAQNDAAVGTVALLMVGADGQAARRALRLPSPAVPPT
jgi:Peptidase A4 family